MEIRKLRQLNPGDKFEVLGLENNGPWELVRTTFGGCEVKTGKRQESFTTRKGQRVSFKKQMRSVISTETLVRKL